MHPGRLGALPDASEVARTTWRRFQIDFKSSVLSTEQHEIVEKLVYAKMKKIMQEREAAARENESRAQAADGGPEA